MTSIQISNYGHYCGRPFIKIEAANDHDKDFDSFLKKYSKLMPSKIVHSGEYTSKEDYWNRVFFYVKKVKESNTLPFIGLQIGDDVKDVPNQGLKPFSGIEAIFSGNFKELSFSVLEKCENFILNFNDIEVIQRWQKAMENNFFGKLIWINLHTADEKQRLEVCKFISSERKFNFRLFN